MKIMFVAGAFTIAMTISPSISAPAKQPDASTVAKVKRILRVVPLIDGHNDVPWHYRKRSAAFDEVDPAGNTGKLRPPMVSDLPQ